LIAILQLLASVSSKAHAPTIETTDKPLPWVIFCICQIGQQTIIMENCVKYHAEMNASRFIHRLIRKNSIVHYTNIRIRYNYGTWEYCMSAPCTHCFKSLCNIDKNLKRKYGKKTCIRIRWTISSSDFVLTPFVNIGEVTCSRLSKGNASKLNRFDQLPP